uniref:Lipocalin/cytosolic fatty-acid binding domain-containing protein n=1 Tax=Sinocyclocheilus anshuiensis TaxID=1608454 RepID=A0A671QWK9_9TELE
MMSFKTALGLLLLAMVAMVAESSWGNGNSYSYDLSKMSDLRKLYNSKVFKAERMTRPLEGMTFQVGKLSHSGVRVTLEDDTKWLVHKGDGYGISSQTVVVAARHMSNNWKIVETKNFRGSKTVSDFVKAGGTDYKLLFDNCHDAADRMMDG